MQDWKIVNSSKYSLSCFTYVFHRCRFVLAFSILAFSVLAFSTVAYSYLRIPYLHIRFPYLRFQSPCLLDLHLLCYTLNFLTNYLFGLHVCSHFSYALTDAGIGKVLQGFFNLWKVEEFYSTYSTYSTLHCMATGRILQYLIKLYITNK